MRYSNQDISQGLNLRTEGQDAPNRFGLIEGASNSTEGVPPKSRMAGVVGQRVLDLQNNPNEIKRTEGWMQAFGMSNPGMEWNRARMMMRGVDPENPSTNMQTQEEKDEDRAMEMGVA